MCYKNNNSIIIDWIRGKDGLKYKMKNNSTHYDLLAIVLQKKQFNYHWLKWGKDGLKYKM